MFVFNLCVVLNHRKRIKYTFHAPLDTDNIQSACGDFLCPFIPKLNLNTGTTKKNLYEFILQQTNKFSKLLIKKCYAIYFSERADARITMNSNYSIKGS